MPASVNNCSYKGNGILDEVFMGGPYQFTAAENYVKNQSSQAQVATTEQPKQVQPETVSRNEDKIIPANGVYAVICQLENELIHGIINIGFKPSIQENKIKTIEIHLFEFDKNIYNRYLKIKVLIKIRDEVKFSSIEKLKIQISKDIKEAQNIINRH